MLKAACEVSPRSLYVCGNSSTSAGLTVSVAKEAGRGGEFTFEAGTVVLGDHGVGEVLGWSAVDVVRETSMRR